MDPKKKYDRPKYNKIQAQMRGWLRSIQFMNQVEGTKVVEIEALEIIAVEIISPEEES